MHSLKIIIVVWLLFYMPDGYTAIPPQATQYYPIISSESQRLLPDFTYVYYWPGLIEHESCISLKHSKCWNPRSRLKTKREEGAGVGQLTKAYNADGSIRFDALRDIRAAHMQELKEISWSNVYQRPDLQIKAMMLLSRQNYQALYMIRDPYQRLAMTDSAYNGGLGSVSKDRRYCGLQAKCDPQVWFNNVATHSLKSRRVIYAGRSAYDINRHHVKDVLTTRMLKYQPYLP